MFCRKCGSEMPDDSAFCPKCGERVVTGDIEETAAAAASPVVSLEKTAEIVSNTPISAEAAVLPQKKNKLKVILISVGALVAVLAVVFFAVILPEMHLDFYYERDPETGEYIILGTVNDVKEINIPDTIWFIPVYAIDDEAFKNSSVESVSFGKNIRYIGMNAFRNCLDLQTVKFSDKMEYDYETGNVMIGAIAFGNCINLKTVHLPDIGTNIYGEAFLGCGNLSKINLDNVDMINFRAFVSCVSLTEVNTKAKLGESAFEDCTSLRSVYLRDTNIPEWCFSGCTELENVHCSYNDGAIQEGAFNNCVNLSAFYAGGDEYNDPNNLQTFGRIAVDVNAFENCESFKYAEPMLKYTPSDFIGEDINDVAQMLGAEYFETSHLEYSSPGLPTFRIMGMPFEYSLEKYYYQITRVTFENQNMWLSHNGGSTDKIHLGMNYDEISDLVNKAKNELVDGWDEHKFFSKYVVSEAHISNDKISFFSAGYYYEVYFDADGRSIIADVVIDMP